MDEIHSDIIEHILQQNPHLRSPPPTTHYSLARGAARICRSLPLLGRLYPPDAKQDLVDLLKAQQANATTYSTWYDASVQLDELSGHNIWKLAPQSRHYDCHLVHRHLVEMRAARLHKDYRLLLYLVRTRWTRNVGNMGDVNLYRHAHVGTKRLVEEYIEECRQLLHYLVHDPSVHLNDRYLLGMLVQTRRNIGRTALVLSGGSTFSLSHVGVLVALLENNLVPRIISGLSSGSIIASILCCHTNDEIGALLRGITDRKFAIFGDLSPADGRPDGRLKRFLTRVGHLLKFGTFFDIAGLRDTMYDFVGDMTFREAYNRTGKILNVTVSPAAKHEQTRLLNYLTAPNCLVWSAICALCLLPGIFPSNSIYEKNPTTNQVHEWNNDQSSKYVDGSVDGDLPISRLLEMFNVDHIIAVQVNPHVAPILSVSVASVGGRVDTEFSEAVRVLLNNGYDFVTNEIIHCLQILHEMNIYQNLTSKLISLLSQQYSGDITILPRLEWCDFLKVFQNPTPQFMLDFILKGARASWPKITVINNHCGVEFALDKEIYFLRGRLIAHSNNRITLPTADVLPEELSTRAIDGYSYLVTSPILSEEVFTSPKALRAKVKIRRHNLLSNGDSKWLRHSPLRKKNASFVDRGSARGSSAVSLTGLATKAYDRDRCDRGDKPEKTESTFYKSLQPYTPDKKNDGSNDGTLSERAKADSGKDPAEPEKLTGAKAIFDFRYSPHHEKTLYFSADYTNYALPKPQLAEQNQKEKANLPKILRAGSLRNSYIELHRLKPSSKSALDLNGRSPSSSPKSTEKANIDHEKNFKSIQPATLRQHFAKRLQTASSDRKKLTFETPVKAEEERCTGNGEKNGKDPKDVNEKGYEDTDKENFEDTRFEL